MDNNTFMGLLIFALIALVGFAATITGLIIKPILNLNKNITKLDLSISNLNKTVNVMENRLDKQQEDIENINKDLRTYEGRISRMEASHQHE